MLFSPGDKKNILHIEQYSNICLKTKAKPLIMQTNALVGIRRLIGVTKAKEKCSTIMLSFDLL